jgi:hypothetical protein
MSGMSEWLELDKMASFHAPSYEIVRRKKDGGFETIASFASKDDRDIACRACNAHYDLLAACEVALEHLMPTNAGQETWTGTASWSELCHQLTAAIRKAKGEA